MHLAHAAQLRGAGRDPALLLPGLGSSEGDGRPPLEFWVRHYGLFTIIRARFENAIVTCGFGGFSDPWGTLKLSIMSLN
jgi:hypothetical protein